MLNVPLSDRGLLLSSPGNKKYNMNEVENQDEQHTGLSPRMKRMQVISQPEDVQFQLYPCVPPIQQNVFFLEDGVETMSADDPGDPRIASVKEIYSSLDRRLERAAWEAGLDANSAQLLNLKKMLALRSAEMEENIHHASGVEGDASYAASMFHLIRWIESVSEGDLKQLLEKSCSASGHYLQDGDDDL